MVLVAELEEDPKLDESRAGGCSAQPSPAIPPSEESNQGLVQEHGAA
jgi:hypothetical protein